MAYTNFDWDREVTVTLTVRDLYYLQHCADSVLVNNEVHDFLVGYVPLTDSQTEGVTEAMMKLITVLKETRIND